jgi:8-oxo-dGTP pyrophosphatase MutT (NUDIX family)
LDITQGEVRRINSWAARTRDQEEQMNKSRVDEEKWGKRWLGANAAIFDDQGQVLLVKHTYGRKNWELPGGVAEFNESIIETALREAREETGLQVVAKHTTGIYYEPELDLLIFVFLCYSQDGTFDHLRPDNNEISECAFWSPDALPRPISDFTIRRVNDASSGIDLPLPALIPKRQWFYE